MSWRRRPFIDRTGCTMLALLKGFDQMAQTLAVAPFAIAGACDIPDPDETVSSVLGRRVATGNRWAIPFAAVVDALFLILTLGKERNHCAKSLQVSGK
jgi:hypothetical protein